MSGNEPIYELPNSLRPELIKRITTIATLGTRGFSRVRREFSVFGRARKVSGTQGIPLPTYIEFSSQLGSSLRIFITENHDSFQLYHWLTRHTKRFVAEMFAQLATEA